MAYQVLARKWRPRNFAEMVGQEHVLRALTNALDNERLHHAYLFTGTRGVGKTTIARILAKSLNCETGVGSTPCGTCASCREIDEGRFVDLIEVDAASRSRVDETRELLDNVQYTPTRGRFKVYLIDEVHMFSGHSFNALLKTLEEPPPHVKFLLATTDPQKLPATILSRCLQFSLKRLPPGLIRDYLGRVLEREGIDYEATALAQLARGADGSMRDALSLLDQAIAFGAGRVAAAEVRAMLGGIAQEQVHETLDALVAADPRAILERVAAVAAHNPDFSAWLADTISLLQRIALAQQFPAAIDDDLGDRQQVLDLAARMSPEDVQLYYQIALIGRRDLPLSPDPRGGFEMVLLRMLAFRPDRAPAPGTAPNPRAGTGSAPPTGQTTRVAPSSPSAKAPSANQAEAGPERSAPAGDLSPKPEAGRSSSPLDEARSLLNKGRGRPRGGGSGTATTAAASPVPQAGAGVPPSATSSGPRAEDPGYSARSGFDGSAALADPPPWEAPPSLGEPPVIPAPGGSPGALPPTANDTPSTSPPTAAADEETKGRPIPAWIALVPRLGLGGIVQELAAQCAQAGFGADYIELALDPAKQGLLNQERKQRLERAVSDALGRPTRLTIRFGQAATETPNEVRARTRAERLEAARRALEDDPGVRLLQRRFAAQLHPETIRPLDPSDGD